MQTQEKNCVNIFNANAENELTFNRKYQKAGSQLRREHKRRDKSKNARKKIFVIVFKVNA